MLKLSDALGEWNPGDAISASDPVALLEAGWNDIVGAEVAANSRPSRIAGGTLTVLARSNAWSHQLSFFAEQVLQAVAARLPNAGIERLRFRVGPLPSRSARPVRKTRRTVRRESPTRRESASASPAEALARFREDVEKVCDARRLQGWIRCERCGALAASAPGLCAACRAARSDELAAATARLLFEAPWLGYGGTAALVPGLKEEEYERFRTRMLSRWWGMLARAQTAGRLSRDGRERLVASSYVLLRSRISPEEIVPATVRNILGDELMTLLYGETAEGGVKENQKRRV